MNYNKYNDYELLYMIREKDENSNDILYEKYMPIIKSLANNYYCKYNIYGAEYEDFVQEACIGFQQAVISFDEARGALFYTFVIMCMKRKLMNFCKRISGNSQDICFVENDNLFFDASYSVEKILDDKELQRIIRNVILDLPYQVSPVFELRLNGFTYREISRLLSVPTSTVEYRIRQGKQLLSKKMHSN